MFVRLEYYLSQLNATKPVWLVGYVTQQGVPDRWRTQTSEFHAPIQVAQN
jgi:hypothetical protein